MQSESEILQGGEVEVWKVGDYDLEKNPIQNGLFDPKMGPAHRDGVCATCHGNFADCPGHYGYLTLALPVYNVGYIGAILEILKCICKSCSRVLLKEQEYRELLQKMRDQKINSSKKIELKKQLVDMCSREKIMCGCGYQNGKVKRNKTVFAIVHEIMKEDGTTEQLLLKPVQVLSLFQQMEDQACELLYLKDRPEKLLLKKIPVPPVALRLPVTSFDSVDGGMERYEDGINVRLQEIIKENACLRRELEEASGSDDGLKLHWETLQNAVALYINSEVHGAPSFQQQSGKPLRGFVQRLKGKQGRFRRNLSGKCVQFTGRTVISPDPNLNITEVGIPIHMALKLTYPEQVTRHNIENLRQRVCNGNQYPGANFVTDNDGALWDLTIDRRSRVSLKIGYIVHRHLEDGDVVLLNRQPSLHRMSIMCHRARILPGKTLRFNGSVCKPYNADFDGDEMNLHVPQTEEARTEALMLMGVQNNLCTPKNGVVLVAPAQDVLTSSFLITRKETFYDRATFSLMCCYMGDAMDHIDLPTPAIIKPIELWTGKQLFHVLLRPNTGMRVYVNLTVREKNYCIPDNREISCGEETMCPNDGFVYFRNSELISGQLGKATLGNGNKIGLYSVLLRNYNAHAAAACMSRLAKLSARWIGSHGFSVVIDDVKPGQTLNNEKCKIIWKNVIKSVMH